ncbi:uncharacterized protein EDB91DRAFT_1247843 [Suillus paluster]|uniref:uncharacterized protein n=1 Tax=Suillus paluster TaxID=48578 RepID=UPI001B881FEE|nr:uncharacterized protein EDB91DRAFT_1247843 [Suillus paluster]KAG1741788.1 hypothetical protein EDB91DRAFT_1247843 [Suillus paluster]
MPSHPALSDATLSEVAYKLRYANARYSQIAFELRCRLKFTRTHHAQRHAFWSGLRVDIAKAKGCPMTAISVRPLPILDTTRSPSPITLPLYMPAAEAHNKLGLDIPDIVVSSPDAYAQPRERLIIRIPPLASLYNDVYRHEQYGMPVPGAPRMRTRELPEECEMEDMCSSRSSSSAFSPSPLTPIDVVHSGLRIRIPTRKRKIEETDDEDSCPDSSDIHFPKRHMRRRWARTQTTDDRIYWSSPRS